MGEAVKFVFIVGAIFLGWLGVLTVSVLGYGLVQIVLHISAEFGARAIWGAVVALFMTGVFGWLGWFEWRAAG